MQVTAKLRHLRISPRKVRLVIDTIRGLDVVSAENNLNFLNKKSARSVLKLLQSAVANAENNFKLKKDNLFIEIIKADEGPTIKRWTPRAQGRATPINKRTSHVTIVLNEKVASKSVATKDEIKTDKNKVVKKEDIKVVQNLDEIRKDKSTEKIDNQKEVRHQQETIKETKDVRHEGSDHKERQLDKSRQQEKGGGLKRVFRRKSV